MMHPTKEVPSRQKHWYDHQEGGSRVNHHVSSKMPHSDVSILRFCEIGRDDEESLRISMIQMPNANVLEPLKVMRSLYTSETYCHLF